MAKLTERELDRTYASLKCDTPVQGHKKSGNYECNSQRSFETKQAKVSGVARTTLHALQTRSSNLRSRWIGSMIDLTKANVCKLLVR
ncbi:hypothetical protein N7478_008388 [Penicillium angulare]|uniref:uncharacterized protein n=1 Tax=Penicillium angulare TaxID=116970 RepID=UPI0025409BF8|nr:uncharacterized protein N7478_008388 [Penicillium angulare]KAJ5273263.1 hypothetical protein N7478_008388 [Penicillium angulare]